jgi:hypothetical protein
MLPKLIYIAPAPVRIQTAPPQSEPEAPTLETLFNEECARETALAREKKLRKFKSIGSRTVATPQFQLPPSAETVVDSYSFTRIIPHNYTFTPITESGHTASQLGQRLCQAIYTTIIRLRADKRIKRLKAQCKFT